MTKATISAASRVIHAAAGALPTMYTISSTNMATQAVHDATMMAGIALVSRRTRRWAMLTAAYTMRNAALAIMAMGPRSKASTNRHDRPAVMKSPSTWRDHSERVNTAGSSPSRAIWYDTLAAPNSVAFTADDVDKSAAMAISLKPNCPRNGSAASARA